MLTWDENAGIKIMPSVLAARMHEITAYPMMSRLTALAAFAKISGYTANMKEDPVIKTLRKRTIPATPPLRSDAVDVLKDRRAQSSGAGPVCLSPVTGKKSSVQTT